MLILACGGGVLVEWHAPFLQPLANCDTGRLFALYSYSMEKVFGQLHASLLVQLEVKAGSAQ